ncbi:MAG TPA: M1 family metallopeptidase [Candidatus Saccharimonadales bacterium]
MQTVSRLAKQFAPQHYDLSLHLRREERIFEGSVTITGELQLAQRHILLHAKGLTITSATIDDKPVTHAFGDNDELQLAQDELTSGQHKVQVNFSGKITDTMHGLYPSYYEEDGNKKEILATQFESHHAREVFPCVDEPEAKATFAITLHTEKDITVLGNMPILTQQEADGGLITQFATTPPMSTYLVAFATGDLHRLQGKTKSGVEVNIWATKVHPLENLEFALDTAIRSIDFFNDYFSTPYPLPKVDHIALPDFSAGAMENWGLITYREVVLVVDKHNASSSTKRRIATVIAHELSHQWFGNLVTMQWWNDLWLNESFASLMEYVALDALFPEWHYWEQFTNKESFIALQRDCIPGVQAIKTKVNHPDEISTLFDPAIVYAKGAKILRMLREYIGDTAFQAGLRQYFASHSYKNTTGDDLWRCLKEASGQDVTSFMRSWIDQSGFPVVTATLSDATLELQQKRFQIGATKADASLWPIPLGGSQASLRTMLSTEAASIKINRSEPIILNSGDVAHFITNYDELLLSDIMQLIQQGKLSSTDRLSILNNLLLLARARQTPTTTIVTALMALRGETDAAVWEIICAAIDTIKRCVEDSPEAETRLRKLAGDLATPPFKQLGWIGKDGEDENSKLTRPLLIATLLYAEVPTIVSGALAQYNKDPHVIPAEIRPEVLTAAVQFAPSPQEVVEHLIKIYTTTSAGDLKSDIITALTKSKDPAVHAKLLELLTSKEIIRPQDTPRWFAYLLRNAHSRNQAWQWLTEQWSWIEATYSGDMSYDVFPRYSANALASYDDLVRYEQFFTPHRRHPALARTIEMGITEITARAEWLKQEKQAVIDALNQL